MRYRCRDCGFKVARGVVANKCPKCGSLYLIPAGFKISRKRKSIGVSFGERLFSLFAGFITGLITFLFYLIYIASGGRGGYGGIPEVILPGLELSFYFALAVSIYGFIFGADRLISLFGKLWGTDKELNKYLGQVNIEIPVWIIFIIALAVIIVSFSLIVIGIS